MAAVSRRAVLAALAILLACAVAARADLPRTIVIDGVFDDWRGVPAYFGASRPGGAGCLAQSPR